MGDGGGDNGGWEGVKTGEDEGGGELGGDEGWGKLVEAAKEADILYELSKSCQCHKIYGQKFHTMDGCSQ